MPIIPRGETNIAPSLCASLLFLLFKLRILTTCFLVEELPELPQIIQNYINQNVFQKDLPAVLMRDHGLEIGYLTNYNLVLFNTLANTVPAAYEQFKNT